MNWFPGSWRIPSAFGNEPPRKGLGFDELPRVRELQQRYAQSSDEEVLDAFRNARITDSVLRFFYTWKPKKDGLIVNYRKKTTMKKLNLKKEK